MASFNRKDSFMRNAGVYDIFQDVNNLPKVPATGSDTTYIIESKYSERVDLLAYDLYGSSRLWWIIVLRNLDVIEDPIKGFKEGLVIKLPSKKTAQELTG